MRHAVSEGVWIIVGSLVVASGSTIAGLYAFDGRVLPVAMGFLLFFAGYWLSQLGVHGADRPTRPSLRSAVRARTVARLGLLGLGGLGIAFGVTEFTRTILDPSPPNAVLAGVSSIGGYMVAHLGMNDNLL